MPTINQKKVLIFGVFDFVHDGHLFFISEAKKHGNQLVAVVARDSVVQSIKGKLPEKNEVDRINDLLKIPDIDLVLLGDGETGTYNVLKETNPDIVFVGYDQNKLLEDLKEKIRSGYLNNSIKILQCASYKGDELHSSILNKKQKA